MTRHLAAAPSRGRRWEDIGERAIWTLLQAGFGVAIVEAANIPQVWAVPIAAALSIVKGQLASKFGDGTAATLPAQKPVQDTPQNTPQNVEEP